MLTLFLNSSFLFLQNIQHGSFSTWWCGGGIALLHMSQFAFKIKIQCVFEFSYLDLITWLPPLHHAPVYKMTVNYDLIRIKYVDQRWKNVQILQIYLCYFFWAVLIFWLYTRKQTKTLCYYHCAKSNMLKLLCY